ncbi:MAG: nucleotide exchange factor GrpE [Nanoarchaeota archaeon]
MNQEEKMAEEFKQEKQNEEQISDTYESNSGNVCEESDGGNEESISLTKSEYEYYKQKAQEADNLTMRIKADFENYKRAIEREKEQFKENTVADFLEKLLPVLDTFEQAIANTKSESEKKGIGLVYSQLFDILQKEGLKPVETNNKKFDPFKHEILMQEEKSNVEDDIILEEFQKGYMFKDRVLRYSKVKVAKNKSGKNEEES